MRHEKRELESKNVAFKPHPKSFSTGEGLSKRRNQKLPSPVERCWG
jgi:hypothetical protein